MNGHHINRRRFLQQGATVAAVATAAAIGTGATPASAARPVPLDQVLERSPKSARSQVRTVVAVSESGRQAQVLLSDNTRSAFFDTWGFPEDYVVAPGEKVVVSDRALGEGRFQINPLVSAYRVTPDKHRRVVVRNKTLTIPRLASVQTSETVNVWTTDNQSGLTRVIAARQA